MFQEPLAKVGNLIQIGFFFREIMSISILCYFQVVGGAAEANGQLMRGDQIMNVNDQDLSESKQDQAVAILKTASGLVKIKVRRYKCLESST